MCSLVGAQDPAVRSIQARGALVWSLLQPQLLSEITHGVAGMWEPRPPRLLVGLVEIKSFSERTCGCRQLSAAASRVIPSCECLCPAGMDALVLPTQVAKPPPLLQALFGAGQSKGLGWGTNPEELGCDESRVEPSPASAQACEIETQKG